MTESGSPPIAFSERLSTGIVVHFENGVSVFFPAAFLYEQRDAESNISFCESDYGDHSQLGETLNQWEVRDKND
jgi:hypothetical protein